MSNALSHDLFRLVRAAEDAQAAHEPTRYRQLVHVTPPVGWLNDPNGLCQVGDTYHAYFQYGPFDTGIDGVKFWGHATSRDLLRWEYDQAVLAPDEPFDCHGAYSGSAVVHDGKISMLYTGNVKLPNADGAFDYVDTGREANTILVETADGTHFGPKRLVMTNADYPADLTCHVRDPKVWRDGERWLMVQGARRHVDDPARVGAAARSHGAGAAFDAGEALVFSSPDLVNWKLENRLVSRERLGFMWECPDYFELTSPSGARTAKLLVINPQGLEGGDWERRNAHQCGYLPLEGDVTGSYELGELALWDAGFDYYATQSFEAADGRRILVAWMSVPDEVGYGNDPTVAEGWQNCLSLPREVWLSEDGRVCQAPVREVEALRGERRSDTGGLSAACAPAFDLVVTGVREGFSAVVDDALSLAWLPAEGELPARFEMRFADASREAAGCGRGVRWESVDEVRDVRVIGDASSVEVFVNDGALAMSTRIYPDEYGVRVSAPGAQVSLWDLQV